MTVCSKIGHDTHEQARQHQLGINKKNGRSTKVYRCPECGKLHIYTIPKGNKLKKYKRHGKRK